MIIVILIAAIVAIPLIVFLIAFRKLRAHKIVDHHTPKSYGMEYENVRFRTADGETIAAWLIRSAKAKATIIVGHGYNYDKANALKIAKFLYPRYNLLVYDHRYFGESTGTITTVGIKEIEDVRAAVRFVRKTFGINTHIGGMGFSLSASTMLRAHLNLDALVADSPYGDLEQVIEQNYVRLGIIKKVFVFLMNLYAQWFFGVHPKKVSPLQGSKSITYPVLLIQGTKDTIVRVHNVELFAKNKHITPWIVDGVGHVRAYKLKQEEYIKRVTAFFNKHL